VLKYEKKFSHQRVKINVMEIGWWRKLDRDRDRELAVVITVMNLRVQQKPGNIMSSRGTINFSRKTVLRGVC
jgi:hypothetical protein